MKLLFKSTILTAALFLLVTTSHASTLVLGVVPQSKSQEIHEIWSPLIQHLNNAGIEVRFSAAPSIPEFEKRLKNGEYDIAYMNPYHLIMANKSQKYLPLLRDHSKKLKGIVVVKKDNNIALSDLNNKEFAFPAPNALGATLLVRAELATKEKLLIIPKYVKTHTAVYRNVAFGDTPAGGGIMKTFQEQPADLKDKLRIIYETTPVAPHPLAIHQRVPKNIAEKITKLLIDYSKTTEGNAVMSKIPMTEVGEATMEDYNMLLDLDLEKFAE